MQVFIIFVNSYADAALGYITSRPRSFWYFFRIMKFCCATASLPIATPLILKWQLLRVLTIHCGTRVHAAGTQSSASIELKGHHIIDATVTRSRRAILILPATCS